METIDNPANALLEQGEQHFALQQFELAISCFTHALQLDPGNVAIMVKLANAHLGLRQLPQAAPLLNAALQHAPENPDVITATGGLYLLDRQFDNACTWLRRAVALKPDDATVHINLAQALTLKGDHKEAIPHLETAIQLDPSNHKAYFAAGRACMELGEMPAAMTHFEHAIQLRPDYGLVYHLLSTIRKFSPDDQAFIQQTENALQIANRKYDQCLLHFALGKIYDDIGNYEKAFHHLVLGNALWEPEKVIHSNPQVYINEQKVCTRKNLKKNHSGNTSDIPVFIVGMPRSGTTLLEQIIASHPLADGAGELTDIERIARLLFSSIEHPKWPWLHQPAPAANVLNHYANDYLAVLQHERGQALRIVDKMPENFLHLGTMALLFPKSRIIHIARHPLDTCISCYQQMFTEVQWAADLKTIAATYRQYRRTMDHWRTVLPAGMMIDVNYEELVNDPEMQSKRIIEFCRLDWDPACLDFFSSKRKVQTASVWQVRQPIYKTSRARWLHYAPWIKDLANDLAEYLQDDRDNLMASGISLRTV